MVTGNKKSVALLSKSDTNGYDSSPAAAEANTAQVVSRKRPSLDGLASQSLSPACNIQSRSAATAAAATALRKMLPKSAAALTFFSYPFKDNNNKTSPRSSKLTTRLD